MKTYDRVDKSKLLNKYDKKIYSQNGEDGVIEFLTSKIFDNNCDLRCLEVGAGDGIHISNTYNLIKNKNGKVFK